MTWKEAMEETGLRVNAGKMKIMICGTGLDLLQNSGEFPCTVCCTGVGSNRIFCNGSKLGAQEMQLSQALTKNPDNRPTWCMGTACLLDGRLQREVHQT